MFKQLGNVVFEYNNGQVIAIPGKYLTKIEMDVGNSYISKFNEELVQRTFYVNSAEFGILREFLDNPIMDICGNEVAPYDIKNQIKDATFVYVDGEEELYIMTSGDVGFMTFTGCQNPTLQEERDSKLAIKRLSQLSDAELAKDLEHMSVSEIETLAQYILFDYDLYSHISCHPHSLLLSDLLKYRVKVMNHDFVWTKERQKQLRNVEKMLWEAFRNAQCRAIEFLESSSLVDEDQLYIKLLTHIKEETPSKHSFKNLLSKFDTSIVVPTENDDYWLDEYSHDYDLMGIITSAIFAPLEEMQCFSVQDILDIEYVDVEVKYHKIYKASPKKNCKANDNSKSVPD